MFAVCVPKGFKFKREYEDYIHDIIEYDDEDDLKFKLLYISYSFWIIYIHQDFVRIQYPFLDFNEHLTVGEFEFSDGFYELLDISHRKIHSYINQHMRETDHSFCST